MPDRKSFFRDRNANARAYVGVHNVNKAGGQMRLVVGLNPSLHHELRHLLGKSLDGRPRVAARLNDDGILVVHHDPGSRHTLFPVKADGANGSQVIELMAVFPQAAYPFVAGMPFHARSAVGAEVRGNEVHVELPLRLVGCHRETTVAPPVEAEALPAVVEAQPRRTAAMLLEVEGEPLAYNLPPRVAQAVETLCAPYRDA